MKLYDLLSQNSVFAHLSDSEREQAATMAIPRNYLNGEWITHYGSVWPYLFIVERGRVAGEKESQEGRSLFLIDLSPGEVFWGTGFFIDAAIMPVALIARADSRISLWPRERLFPYLMANGQMAWGLARLMVARMQRASEIVEELAFQPVTGRLARLLLERFGNAVGESVTRDMTLDEMAAHIGTTREMVCRQLYRFADEGVIHITRTEVMISDQANLERIAGKGRS